MRILFVTNQYPTPQTPGAGPAIAQQRQALEDLGHQVDVLFFDSIANSLRYLTALPRLLVATTRTRYDVVHAHYGYLVGLLARLQWRSPVVVTFRGSDVLRPEERRISRPLAQRIDAAVVMSEEMRGLLGRPDATIIPYGIDTSRFQPSDRAEARRRLDLPPDAPLVLFPYSPERTLKRFDLVSEAMARVKKAIPSAELISIHGRPHDLVPDFMNACDVLVLASDTEGSPVAVREAMACALPVVSVDVGDVASLLESVEPSWVVDRDPGALAGALVDALRSPRRSEPTAATRIETTAAGAEAVDRLYRSLVRGIAPKSAPTH